MHRVAQIVLRDHRGWILLQERDEHAPTHPDMWGFVGGGVDAGESFRDAAIRELEEETGLTLDLEPTEVATYEVPCALDGEVDEVHLFFVTADVSDADIGCHEGRQIVFVDPARLEELELAPPTRVGMSALRPALHRGDQRASSSWVIAARRGSWWGLRAVAGSDQWVRG